MENEWMSGQEETRELPPGMIRAVQEVQEGRSIESNARILVDAIRPELCDFFRSRGFDEAEDLAQDVFLEVFTRIDKLKEPAEFRHWLFGIAGKIAYKAYRDRSRRSQRTDELAARCRNENSVDDLWVFGGRLQESPEARLLLEDKHLGVLRDLRALWSAVAGMSHQMRRCLVFRLQGRPLEEIARDLGITTGSVKRHISRAARRAREVIAAGRPLAAGGSR